MWQLHLRWTYTCTDMLLLFELLSTGDTFISIHVSSESFYFNVTLTNKHIEKIHQQKMTTHSSIFFNLIHYINSLFSNFLVC